VGIGAKGNPRHETTHHMVRPIRAD